MGIMGGGEDETLIRTVQKVWGRDSPGPLEVQVLAGPPLAGGRQHLGMSMEGHLL